VATLFGKNVSGGSAADLSAPLEEAVEAAGGGGGGGDRASSFEEALASDSDDADADDAGGSTSGASSISGPTPLQGGWTQLQDPDTGRLYYVSPTGKPQWDVPRHPYGGMPFPRVSTGEHMGRGWRSLFSNAPI
jgi:hypothetical protein